MALGRSTARSRDTSGADDALDQRRAARLRAELLAWFANARRALPWRRDRDAYRVWISEAMLQQTRVETVVPYFERFLARFPDARALADADEASVLAAWSGLGYYRRARSLHAAARAIVERHGGAFPRTRDDALALPGIGPYTAGAVLSIAYDAPEALVDGNVARVLARLFALDGAPESPAFQRRVWELARSLVPERGAGEWNQALMELGALVCTPRNAACAACPWSAECAALASGRVDELPRPKTRPAVLAVELVSLWSLAPGGVLLEQRPAHGRMANLWQLPTIELGEHARIAPLAWPAGVRVRWTSSVGELRHAITRHAIRVDVRAGELVTRTLPERWRRVRADELATLARTGMLEKSLRLAPIRAELAR